MTGRSQGRLSQSQQLTQKSQKKSQSQRKSVDYSLTDLKRNEYLGNCINCILLAMNKNDAIKKPDIVANALDGESKALPFIWGEVVKTLYDIFGYVVYCDNLDSDGNQLKAVPDRFFVKLEGNEFGTTGRLRKKHGSPEQAIKDGLLVQVLSVIFMKGDACPEEVLWKFVERLGVDSLIQDYKKVVSEEFCRGQYLIKDVPDTDPPVITYKWGFRAECEVSKEALLKYICNLYKKTPADFREQKSQIDEQQSLWAALTRNVTGEAAAQEEEEED